MHIIQRKAPTKKRIKNISTETFCVEVCWLLSFTAIVSFLHFIFLFHLHVVFSRFNSNEWLKEIKVVKSATTRWKSKLLWHCMGKIIQYYGQQIVAIVSSTTILPCKCFTKCDILCAVFDKVFFYNMLSVCIHQHIHMAIVIMIRSRYDNVCLIWNENLW